MQCDLGTDKVLSANAAKYDYDVQTNTNSELVTADTGHGYQRYSNKLTTSCFFEIANL
jgi:hypothetical protein